MALAIALSLVLGVVWLAFSSVPHNRAELPAGEPRLAAQAVAVERLEASPSAAVPQPQRAVASSARASTEDVADFRRKLQPPNATPQPAGGDFGLPCRLTVRVIDADGQPVISLQRLALSWGTGVQEHRLYTTLQSENGEYECAIANAPGTVDAFSTALGSGSEPYSHPSGETSRVDLKLGFLAAIQGRVVHEGTGVADAQVTLLSVDSPQPDPLTRIVAHEPVSPCRMARGQVSSGADGCFRFAVPWRGRFRICAREPTTGACLSEPFEITEHRKPIRVELELAPAAHLEVHRPATHPWWKVQFVRLSADNGIDATARCDERDGVASFDCLPAGSYAVLRDIQYWTPLVGDPPVHVELDGAPETVRRTAWSLPGTTSLEIQSDRAQESFDAELYRLGCCATLVGKRDSRAGSPLLLASDQGEHLLAVSTTFGDGTRCTRVFRLTLAAGRNEFRLPTLEPAGGLILGTNRRDLPPGRVLARFELEGGGQLFIPLHDGGRLKYAEAEKDRHVTNATLPIGTCDLVRERDGQFEVLRSEVRIPRGAPTLLRL